MPGPAAGDAGAGADEQAGADDTADGDHRQMAVLEPCLETGAGVSGGLGPGRLRSHTGFPLRRVSGLSYEWRTSRTSETEADRFVNL